VHRDNVLRLNRKQTAGASNEKEKFGSNCMSQAQTAATFCHERKRLVRRHMKFLSARSTMKASPKSAQISEIARSTASRDVVRCGVMLCRAKLDCGE
jgi:hypothetical protein